MNKLEKTVLEFLTSWLESDLSEADIQLNSGQETEIVMNQTDESFDVLAIRFKPEIIQVEQTDPSGCEGTGDYYNELRHIEVLSITADNTEIECVKTIKFVRNTIFNYFENKID